MSEIMPDLGQLQLLEEEQKIIDTGTCEECRFYVQEKNECRRFPPTIYPDTLPGPNCGNLCSFPTVKKDEWCGEFDRGRWIYRG